MTAADVMTELHRRGVQLEAVGDKLRFRPKEAVTPDLVEVLKQQVDTERISKLFLEIFEIKRVR